MNNFQNFFEFLTKILEFIRNSWIFKIILINVNNSYNISIDFQQKFKFIIVYYICIIIKNIMKLFLARSPLKS